MTSIGRLVKFGLSLVLLPVVLVLTACTQATPMPTPTSTSTFEDLTVAPPPRTSEFAERYPDVAAVIIGRVVEKTHETVEPSPTGGVGCPCTDRLGLWAVEVERYLVNPQPYERITFKVIEETTREDGSQAARWGSQPPPLREGDRAVFFLERRITSLYPLLTGDTYGGFGAVRHIEDGLVDVARYGGVHIAEWVPLEVYAESIVAMTRPGGSVPAATHPDASLEPPCLVTLALPGELLWAVIGEDPVPTAADAVNRMHCSFNSPITQLTVELVGEDDSQTATIPFPVPVNDLRFPLPPGLNVPLIRADLPPGRYERTVTASNALGGPEAHLHGFAAVILVREPASVTARLLRAQSRWERSGAVIFVLDGEIRTRDYTYRVAWKCFCPPEYVADVDVVVVNGQVTQLSFAEPEFTGEVPDPQRFGPVSELFAFVEDAVARDAARIDATFDPDRGYPANVFVDFDERIADEERGFIVRSLSFI